MFSVNIKAITTGVDTKTNTLLSLQENLSSFTTIPQGAMESDNEYLTKIQFPL